jgi:hypothetical protein
MTCLRPFLSTTWGLKREQIASFGDIASPMNAFTQLVVGSQPASATSSSTKLKFLLLKSLYVVESSRISRFIRAEGIRILVWYFFTKRFVYIDYHCRFYELPSSIRRNPSLTAWSGKKVISAGRDGRYFSQRSTFEGGQFMVTAVDQIFVQQSRKTTATLLFSRSGSRPRVVNERFSLVMER